MTIAELLDKIGNERVAVQYLDQCGLSFDWSAKRGTKITFGSDAKIKPDGTEKLGIIVWLNRDDVRRALDADKGASS